MTLPIGFEPDKPVSKYTLGNLQSGSKVKIRVLSDFISGRSVWGENAEGKRVPTRRKMDTPIPASAIGINTFTGKPESIKQFIAAVVWNYTTKQVEIFETDKSTIIEQIVEIEDNEDWGDTKGFDLTVSKKGEKMETEYSVIASNKADFKCSSEWEQVNLEALYTNNDPFVAATAAPFVAATPTTDQVADDAMEALR